jgi:hypothetical protein
MMSPELVGGYGEELIAYGTRISLVQSTFLERTPNINVLSEIWSVSSVGIGYRDKDINNQIRGGIKDLVDMFINVYLSVNPKTGK